MALERAPARRQEPEILAVRFVQAMDRASSVAVVQQSFQELIEQLDFSYVICARLSASQQLDRQSVLMCTWPAEFADTYYAHHYAHDVILRKILRSRCAIDWPQVFEGRSLSPDESRMIEHAARVGMRFGLAIPITEAGGNVGFVGLSGPHSCTDARCRSALTLVSIYVYHRLRALAAANGTGQRLSRRELEVLRWIAEGKSDWQIGRILAISAKTVNYHIENVKRKFGVATRMQAVVSAIQRGELITQ